MTRNTLTRFSTVQNTLFFGLLALGTGAFIWLINDFIMPVFWAIVLAIVFYPLQHRWAVFVRNRTVASLLTISSVILVIFVPLWIIGGLVVEESISTYDRFATGSFEASRSSIVNQALEQLNKIDGVYLDEEGVKEKLSSFVQVVSAWFAREAFELGQATFGVMVSFLLMLYLLFFMLRDGPRIGRAIEHTLPLGNEREEALFTNFARITRSIFKGTLAIALIQGAIGGALFWIAGIDGALLWGVVMTLLSIIPAIGPSIVWLPAGVILLLSGFMWQGAVVLVGGVVIISLVDNILRPLLVGRDVKIPDAIILLSTIGGLSVFGITGIIIGPVIAGFFLSLWKIFEVDYRKDLETQG
ncbi:MAG: AI-2E family transporter [Candidatus Pacebacteria bacterium]|nr:AI-2E family transporter [Candidatus Paceibacterota bacterium]